MARVRLYIDGFNFHHSVKHGDFPIALGWCDFRQLAETHMVRSGDVLEAIKYFTARVTPRFAKRKGEERRQEIWVAAAGTTPGIQIIRGFHQQHETKSREESKPTSTSRWSCSSTLSMATASARS